MTGEHEAHWEWTPSFPELSAWALCLYATHCSLCYLPTVILRSQLLEPPRVLAEGIEANRLLSMF